MLRETRDCYVVVVLASDFQSSRLHLRWQRVGGCKKEEEEQTALSSAAAGYPTLLGYYEA